MPRTDNSPEGIDVMLCNHVPDWSLQAVITGHDRNSDVLVIPVCQDCALVVANEIVKATGLPVTFRRFSPGDIASKVS
ncbi:hypothetical protein ACFWPK_31830 [Nocardia sp. NPDC058519]|uniref:hypothetical protein n=1 Tax=Nocardia sp. NPDC058519 TaxID=3346535 RepID=UPI0036524E67